MEQTQDIAKRYKFAGVGSEWRRYRLALLRGIIKSMKPAIDAGQASPIEVAALVGFRDELRQWFYLSPSEN